MEKKKFQPQRLDITLAEKYKDISRSIFQKLIRTGGVRVNGTVIKKSHFPVEENAQIIVDEKMLAVMIGGDQSQKVQAKHEVLYKENGFIVVNKPPNIRTEDYVAPLLPVHRLDKDTSGVLVIAENIQTQGALQKLWKDRKVNKEYIVLIRGVLTPDKGEIQAPIARSTSERRMMAVSARRTARTAVTQYKVEEVFGDVSLVHAFPLTGRTHQIRVHFASIGHPVLGDSLYGDIKLNKKFAQRYGLKRQFLHAHKLNLQNPNSKKRQTFTAELPADLAEVLKKLQSKSKS